MRFIFSILTGILCVTGFAAAAGGVGTGPRFKGPLGLQLYSLREEFARNVPETLQKVHKLGFKYVELAGTYNLSAEEFKKLLDQNELTPVGNLIGYERFRDDPAGVAKECRTLGIKYVGCAWIPHKDPFDEAQAKEAVEVFNRAGKVLKKEGITFYYHFHGFEFQPHGSETLVDWMIRACDSKAIQFEMDVFWVTHAGQNPADWLRKYSRRWIFMHVKDMRKGTPTGLLNGQSDVRNDVAIGTGQINWPLVLKTARRAGLKYYFIEDESPTVNDQIPLSIRYLEHISW